MAAVTFDILGPIRVRGISGQEVALTGKQHAVLVALLLNANESLSRERLIDALWDAPPASAVSNLQTHVARIRKTFAADLRLVTNGSGYLLEVATEDVDLLIFDREVRAARAEVTRGDLGTAVRRFAGALELWRGSPAEGVQLNNWARSRLDELEENLAEARLDCAAAKLEIGLHTEVIGELRPFLEAQPLSERAWRLLMLAYSRTGQRHRALEAYQQARTRLVDELGIEPGDELRQLQAAILADELPAAGPEPRRAICQLAPDYADFVGRHEQLAAVTRNLLSAHDQDPGGHASVPISAISGQGGVGKTTLAVHVAHQLRHAFPDGQLYVDLRGGESHPVPAAEVLGRFLRALGVESSTVPAELDERAEIYRERLADRRYLVVLDNAADEAQLLPLIPGTPGCAVLVTSRQRLTTLPATQRVDLDVLTAEEAVEMLGNIVGDDKIAEAPADAHTLVELCGRLPLAVRIAAAKFAAHPHWSLEHLVSRLSDTHGRLRQLSHGGHEVRASFNVGYHSLSSQAQRMFRRLGLLETPDFAVWVGAALLDTSEHEAEQLIEQLADVRLLEVADPGPDGQVRFRFHDLTRAYARECAEAETDGDRRAALERAFSGWLVMTQRAHAALCGGDYRVIHGLGIRWRPDPRTTERAVVDPLAWIDVERAGIVAGVRQCAELALDELCWDLAASAMNLLETRNLQDEWHVTHETALRRARTLGDIRAQAAILTGLARLSFAQDDLASCGDALDEALDLFDRAGDRHGHALALVSQAELRRQQGRYDDARACFEQAADGLAQAGDRGAEITVMRGIGRIHFAQGRFDAAEPFIRRAIRLAADTGDVRSREFTRIVLGEIELARGDLAAAEEQFIQALIGLDTLGFPNGVAYASLGLASARIERRDFADAERLLHQALAIYRDTDDRMSRARVLFTLAELRRRERRLDEAVATLGEVIAICQAITAPRRHGLALRALGEVHRDTGDLLAATDAWRRSLTILATISSPEADEVADLLQRYTA